MNAIPEPVIEITLSFVPWPDIKGILACHQWLRMGCALADQRWLEACRDRHVFLAVIAESAERYEDMYRYAMLAVKAHLPFTDQEAELFINGMGRVLSTLRISYRVTSRTFVAIPVREMLRKTYSSEIALQFIRKCEELDNLLAVDVIPFVQTDSQRALAWKQRLSYQAQRVEMLESEERDSSRHLAAIEKMRETLAVAEQAAQKLSDSHECRLGVALTAFSVRTDRLRDTASALSVAKAILDGATQEKPAPDSRNSLLLLQMLRDNILLLEDAQNTN
eukprot:TRINITY_DN80921_c0_g1_i1.p1 TRINITY_DN80921_c0_g1~~TRINITY_DN80921_c0_g1_i1.p1  ORF type:complete len:287 (+),score=50.32 TRINITY_DN80921_c0_g1_i1:28-861(+)